MAVLKPAYTAAGTAALQWYVANTSAYIPAGVVTGGGTITSAVYIQKGVTVVQGGAADPLWAGYQQYFTPLDMASGQPLTASL